MGKFRMIQISFWEDDKVMEEMTPEDRYFFLYLLTNPKTTAIGIYQLSKRRMAYETGYSVDTVQLLIERFEDYHELIRYNPETRELAIKNWGKYNFNRGGKPVLDCVRAELKKVQDQSLIAYVGETMKTSPMIEHEKSEGEMQLLQGENGDLDSVLISASENGFTFEDNFNKEHLFSWLKKSNLTNPRDALIEALDTAIRNNKRNLKYVMGILKNWDKKASGRQDNESHPVPIAFGPGANYDPRVDRF